MEAEDREKIAIVLAHEYKKILDDIKRNLNTPDMLVRGQVVELRLMDFTENSPIAKNFVNKIIEYRRDKTGAIKTITIPVIRGISVLKDQPKEKSAPNNTPIIKEPIKKPEEKKDAEDYPFEF